MPVSPRTQAFMQPPPTEEDATLAFEDGFSQMAQRVFSTKYPELMDYVVTFKILKSDLDTGSGVGAFILSIDGEEVYVPVVLATNNVKPIDIMYFKERDIFLPLTPEWLEEIARGSLDELGDGVKPPDTLNPDQDIRSVVVPPNVGRYAFSAEATSGVKLAQFLASAPNHVKLAFRTVLQNNHDILKFAFETYDKDMILESLRPHVEKTAAVERSVEVLTPNDKASRFRDVFGKEASAAWQEAVKKGYVISDTRENVNRAVETEDQLKLTNIQENGFYHVYMADGKRRLALVVADPQPFDSRLEAGKSVDATPRSDPYKQHKKKRQNDLIVGEESDPRPPDTSDQRWLVYFENGDIYTTNSAPVGEWVPAEEVTGNLAKIMDDTNRPMSRGYGVFTCSRGGKFRATEPIEIESITTGSDGVRRARTFSPDVLVTDPNSPIKQIVAPKGSNVVYIPAHYKFLKGNRQYDTKLLEGAADTLSHVERLEKIGALKIKLIDAGADMFALGGMSIAPMSKLGMVEVLVADVRLRQEAAEQLIKKAASEGKAQFYVVNDKQLRTFGEQTKIAQGMPMPPPGPPGGAGGMVPPGMPPEGAPAIPPEGEIPPEMAAMMAAPPEPPPPNPIELAVGDVESQVVEQSADVAEQLADEQRELANKMNILQAVRERAAQIDAEMSGMPPPGPPTEVQQVPPPGTMPPEMGAMPPGAMPPEMGAMPPGAMPPEMGAMPPGAEGPAAMELASQMEGPMGAAAQLKDPAAFEATSIGTMAADSNLRESVADYMPTLEEALDNLGRILLTMWLQEYDLRQELGDEAYTGVESQLLTVFQNLGSLILKINQTAMPVKPEDEESA